MNSAEQFAKNVATLVKGVIEKSIKVFHERIESLERSLEVNRLSLDDLIERIDTLPTPVDGKDAEPVTDGQIDARLSEYLTIHPIEVPEPIPGEKGEAGKDADPIDLGAVVEELLPALAPRVQEAVAEAVAGIPIPEPIPGEKGEAGKDADPVELSAVIEELVPALAPTIEEQVAKAVDLKAICEMLMPLLKPVILEVAKELVAQIPAPKDGEDAVITDDMLDIAAAKYFAIHPPERGRDGRDITNEDVRSAVKLHMLENPVQDGKDGIDGISFTDMEAVYDGERTVTLRFTKGDVVKEFPIHISTIIYRGTYKHATEYQEGDIVTWDGSMWVAKKDTSAMPLSGHDWTLAVKRGQNGKDGKSIQGEQGPKGKDGKDLTMHSERGR
jgi:hypothetical protein